MPTANPSKQLKGLVRDPFAQEFLFAMGENTARLKEVSSNLAELKDTIKENRKETQADISAVDTKIDGVADRVSSLERWKWAIMGGAAVLATIVQKAWEFFIR